MKKMTYRIFFKNILFMELNALAPMK